MYSSLVRGLSPIPVGRVGRLRGGQNIRRREGGGQRCRSMVGKSQLWPRRQITFRARVSIITSLEAERESHFGGGGESLVQYVPAQMQLLPSLSLSPNIVLWPRIPSIFLRRKDDDLRDRVAFSL
ncbi:hypothetical protein M407DRAFT_107346 [Tulasnella calospora MUT 4182]|uniref:Uncharacterized protein n=1 Tax=Tulasnella calospora MUT 4182 TaxID=1051891 RepID=A0A0C3QDN4_9AGAM|nr:hypothetical protein M407DRAFT_107346 [Tulasnella calospora MUT 4182]